MGLVMPEAIFCMGFTVRIAVPLTKRIFHSLCSQSSYCTISWVVSSSSYMGILYDLCPILGTPHASFQHFHIYCLSLNIFHIHATAFYQRLSHMKVWMSVQQLFHSVPLKPLYLIIFFSYQGFPDASHFLPLSYSVDYSS